MLDLPDSIRGFTLIELLVTLSVAGVLASVAIPSFQSFVVSSRMTSQANDLVSTLMYARSEAVKRALPVSVCASSDGATCTGNWQQGWIIPDPSGGATPIRVQQALGGASTISGGANVAGGVTFTSDGRTTLASTATAAATTFTLCPPSPAGTLQGRAIQVASTGRTNVASVACP
jgi:prepilin-type N-terminal cleavage/methylation domain